MTSAAVVLAAGRGTRMRSPLPKVLHELRGRTLLDWVLGAVRPVVDEVVVVVGHGGEAVAEHARRAVDDVRIVVQPRQHGTGHALQCAAGELADVTEAFVLAGDVPLVRTETLGRLAEARRADGAAAAVLTFRPDDPSGYGRILRAADGSVEVIVEDRDATPAQRAVGECNAGTWVLSASACLPLLDRLPRAPNGERYLTDIVALLRHDGLRVASAEAAAVECAGVNSPEQLAELDRLVAERGGSGTEG